MQAKGGGSMCIRDLFEFEMCMPGLFFFVRQPRDISAYPLVNAAAVKNVAVANNEDGPRRGCLRLETES